MTELIQASAGEAKLQVKKYTKDAAKLTEHMILKAADWIISRTFECLERQNKLASGLDGQHLINAPYWDIW